MMINQTALDKHKQKIFEKLAVMMENQSKAVGDLTKEVRILRVVQKSP